MGELVGWDTPGNVHSHPASPGLALSSKGLSQGLCGESVFREGGARPPRLLGPSRSPPPPTSGPQLGPVPLFISFADPLLPPFLPFTSLSLSV